MKKNKKIYIYQLARKKIYNSLQTAVTGKSVNAVEKR